MNSVKLKYFKTHIRPVASLIKTISFISILFTLLTSTETFAVETASVLPKGIFRARVVGVLVQPITEKYNQENKVETLTASLNRSVTIQDMARSSQDLQLLLNSLNTIDPQLAQSLASANLYSDLKTEVSQVMPALEYGLTDQVSLGIRIPVITRKVTNSFYVDGVNNSQAVANQVYGLNQLYAGVQTFGAQAQLNTAYFEQKLFTDKGYEAPRSFTKTEVGDTEAGVKYNFFKNDTFTSTALWGIRLPTGSIPSLTNRFDTGTGNGSFATAIQGFQEAKVMSRLTLGAAAKLTYNFSSTRKMAVPKDENDSLPSVKPEGGQVQDVTRQMAPQFDGEISSTVKVLDSVNTWIAAQYMKRGQDTYTGAGNLYYEGLMKNTETEITSGELGISYSTIPAFRKKQFSVPMELHTLYNQTLSGKNTPIANYVRTDLMVFF